MKKQVADGIGLGLQSIAFVLLFIPGMFYWEHWEQEGFGISKLSMRLNITFFHAKGNTADMLGNIIVFLMIVNAIWLIIDLASPNALLKMFKTEKTVKAIQIIISILTVVLFLIFAVVAGTRDDYGYQAPVNSLFYFEMLILAGIVLFSILKKSDE